MRTACGLSSEPFAQALKVSSVLPTFTGFTKWRSRPRRCFTGVPLGLDPLYAEVKARIADMNTYLDTDSIRRQANTVVRLTVVTIFGWIGTVTTGILGMNLLAEADAPWPQRLGVFAATFVLTTLFTVYNMVNSRKLSDFLDNLSDDRLSAWQKTKAFFAVWGKEREIKEAPCRPCQPKLPGAMPPFHPPVQTCCICPKCQPVDRKPWGYRPDTLLVPKSPLHR